MIDDVIAQASAKMDKTITNLNYEFSTVRTGRASAAMLDRIMIDYYGTSTPVTQLASVKTPEAHMLVVEPWDKQILNDISKAIMASDLGINPSNDGSIIRLPFPPPTEERRRELVKQCRRIAEDGRVALRNERRDANTKLERMIKEEDASKDDIHRAEEQIQKLTDKHVEEVEAALKRKEEEVMEV